MTKGTTKAKRQLSKSPRTKQDDAPADYVAVLADMKQLIAAARRHALATVNRELVGLYWQIGRTIVERQQQAEWGDAVVEQLSQDLRLAFPDFAGLTSDNMWRMRKFCISCEDIDRWLNGTATAPARLPDASPAKKLGTVCPEKPSAKQGRQVASAPAPPDWEIWGTLSPQIQNAELPQLVESLSWSHHRTILGAAERADERYFYGGYRHEFGSLREFTDAFHGGELKDSTGTPITREVFDLAAHLLVTHHGRGRPHFPKGGFDPDDESHSDELHLESIRRFARLQRKYGWWYLAWLENLLRCADAMASADPDSEDAPDDSTDAGRHGG